MRWVGFCLLLAPSVLAAQDGRLGIHFYVGEGFQVGVTGRVSPKVMLRPSLVVDWISIGSTSGDDEFTQYGLDFDVLFRGPSWDRLRAYFGFGAGGSVINASAPARDGELFIARGFVGARVRIVGSVALFVEAGVEYQDADPPFSTGFSAMTSPIGIVVFFK